MKLWMNFLLKNVYDITQHAHSHHNNVTLFNTCETTTESYTQTIKLFDIHAMQAGLDNYYVSAKHRVISPEFRITHT